jgi:glycosyltransferase involved in cell wall biosynthesis
MRLAYVSSSTVPSGAANSVQVMRMCDAFAGRGHDVLLLARRGDDRRQDVHDWYGTRRAFTVDLARPTDIRWVGMPLRAAGAATRVRQWRADLAFGRDPIGLLGAALAGVPVVYELHHPPESRARAAIEHLLFRQRQLTHLVAISAALAARYRPLVPENVEIIVAHDAADDPGPMIEPPSSMKVGYTGSLHPGKGLGVILALARALPEVQFEIVGGAGSQLSAARSGAPHNVDLVGEVPPAEISERLRSFSIALAPYQESVRGTSGDVDLAPWMSPLKVFDYLAHGLPIVASNLAVLQEILIADRTALLVPPGDERAWAGAVSALVADDTRRLELGRQARLAFTAGLTWDARAAAVLGRLDSPTARKAPPRGAEDDE